MLSSQRFPVSQEEEDGAILSCTQIHPSSNTRNHETWVLVVEMFRPRNLTISNNNHELRQHTGVIEIEHLPAVQAMKKNQVMKTVLCAREPGCVQCVPQRCHLSGPVLILKTKQYIVQHSRSSKK